MAVAAPKKRKKKAKSEIAKEELKRMKQAHQLAEQIKTREEDLKEQSALVASAKATHGEERTKELGIEAEIEQLKNDLVQVSAGGFIDRLPFTENHPAGADKKAEGGTGAQAIKQGLDEAARQKAQENTDADEALFKTATLADLGIKGALAENLSADGIKNGADLQAWFAEGHTQRAIRGVGPEAKSKLQDLMLAFYENLAKTRPAVGEASEICAETEQTIASVKAGRQRYLDVAIAQREDGTFASRFGILIDAATGDMFYQQDFLGSFPTREKAIEEAVGAVRIFIESKRKIGLDEKAEARAKEIEAALDGIGKDVAPAPSENGKPRRYKGNPKNRK